MEKFVAAMEDILDVYTRKYDKKRPLVCIDEASRQLIGEVRAPVPVAKGKPARYDTEYKRNGTCEIFMPTTLLENRERADAAEGRTKIDYARQTKKLVTVDFPDAEKIILIQDNLNTHTTGALYKAFPPEEARKIRDKLEIHYAPKHESWLNMAEIEINALVNHGLSRRVASMERMKKEVSAWTKTRNMTANKINWRFTTEDARIKLKHLYPHFD